MTIDWSALGLVAITTLVAAIAVIGIFSLGVFALTGGARATTDDQAAGAAPVRAETGAAAKAAGYACLAIAGLLVLYGLYLIIPQFH